MSKVVRIFVNLLLYNHVHIHSPISCKRYARFCYVRNTIKTFNHANKKVCQQISTFFCLSNTRLCPQIVLKPIDGVYLKIKTDLKDIPPLLHSQNDLSDQLADNIMPSRQIDKHQHTFNDLTCQTLFDYKFDSKQFCVRGGLFHYQINCD